MPFHCQVRRKICPPPCQPFLPTRHEVLLEGLRVLGEQSMEQLMGQLQVLQVQALLPVLTYNASWLGTYMRSQLNQKFIGNKKHQAS